MGLPGKMKNPVEQIKENFLKDIQKKKIIAGLDDLSIETLKGLEMYVRCLPKGETDEDTYV